MKIITLTLVFYILVCFSIKAHETPNPKIEREIENRTLACSGDLFIIDQNYKEEIDIFFVTIHVDTNSGLQSTGYAFIGSDPFSQENFIRDINEEQGQRRFTEVKILPEDIEGL